MTDAKDQPDTVVMEAGAIKSVGLSQDSKLVRMVMAAAKPGDAVVITMPTADFPEFYRGIGELLMKLRNRKIVPQGSMPQTAQTWMVGQSDNPDLKAFTALMFDKGRPTEQVFMFLDQDAIAMADAIEANIYKKLTPEEKAKIDKFRREHSARPKIILPN